MHEDVGLFAASTHLISGGRMAGDLDGMKALVTGATSGIGRATALRFAVEGARVALVARSAEGLKEVAGEIKSRGGEAVEIRADVMIEDDASRAIAEAVETLGGLDVLVNAAGIISNGTVENTTLADWDAMMNVNLRSVFHIM